MNTLPDHYLANLSAARKLIDSVPEGEVNKHDVLLQLPWILEAALELLLEDVDIAESSSSASGCRILAACINRMED